MTYHRRRLALGPDDQHNLGHTVVDISNAAAHLHAGVTSPCDWYHAFWTRRQADVRRLGRRRLLSGSNTTVAKSVLAASVQPPGAPSEETPLVGPFRAPLVASDWPLRRLRRAAGAEDPSVVGRRMLLGQVPGGRRSGDAGGRQYLNARVLCHSQFCPVPIGIREAEATCSSHPLSYLPRANYSCLSSSPHWLKQPSIPISVPMRRWLKLDPVLYFIRSMPTA